MLKEPTMTSKSKGDGLKTKQSTQRNSRMNEWTAVHGGKDTTLASSEDGELMGL